MTHTRKKLNKFEFEELSEEYKNIRKLANRVRLLYGSLLGFGAATLFFMFIRLLNTLLRWFLLT